MFDSDGDTSEGWDQDVEVNWIVLWTIVLQLMNFTQDIMVLIRRLVHLANKNGHRIDAAVQGWKAQSISVRAAVILLA